ncbi:MAG: hypothetical protein QM662_10835 [Gordonia sp. (in: high G+C Gram-positive bacteria)]
MPLVRRRRYPGSPIDAAGTRRAGPMGAAGMREPREGEIVTEASLVPALQVAAAGATVPRTRASYTVRIGDVAAHAPVGDGVIEVGPGEYPDSDLVIVSGPAFRDLLAGAVDPATAVADGTAAVAGDAALLGRFTSMFTVPSSPSVSS